MLIFMHPERMPVKCRCITFAKPYLMRIRTLERLTLRKTNIVAPQHQRVLLDCVAIAKMNVSAFAEKHLEDGRQ